LHQLCLFILEGSAQFVRVFLAIQQWSPPGIVFSLISINQLVQHSWFSLPKLIYSSPVLKSFILLDLIYSFVLLLTIMIISMIPKYSLTLHSLLQWLKLALRFSINFQRYLLRILVISPDSLVTLFLSLRVFPLVEFEFNSDSKFRFSVNLQISQGIPRFLCVLLNLSAIHSAILAVLCFELSTQLIAPQYHPAKHTHLTALATTKHHFILLFSQFNYSNWNSCLAYLHGLFRNHFRAFLIRMLSIAHQTQGIALDRDSSSNLLNNPSTQVISVHVLVLQFHHATSLDLLPVALAVNLLLIDNSKTSKDRSCSSFKSYQFHWIFS